MPPASIRAGLIRMDFEFTAEQQILRQQARRFFTDHCAMATVRRLLDAPALNYDPTLWANVASQGYLAAGIPEDYGGLGLGPLETCVIAGEAGRALAPLPLASTVYLAAPALLAWGCDEQRRRWLPAIAAGQAIGCLARSDASGSPGGCRYEDGRIHGVKAPVTDGMIADFAIVPAGSDAGTRLLLVDLHAAGIHRRPLATLDPTRGAARLEFDGAHVEPLQVPDADAAVDAALCRAAVFLAFEQIGGADRCLEMARDYALERHVFGAPIGRYQAIKHKLADIYVANELARSNAYYAAWALESGDATLPAAAAAARVSACDAYWRAARENIHVHGGIGFTWEMDCHLYYRRAHLLSLLVGAPDTWRARLLTELGARRI